MKRVTVSADGETITVHIPLTFRKRGGRKLVVMPDGAEWAPRPRVDNAMVKALARAFRWRKMLDEGVCGTIEELVTRERVNRGRRSSTGGSRRNSAGYSVGGISAEVGGAAFPLPMKP